MLFSSVTSSCTNVAPTSSAASFWTASSPLAVSRAPMIMWIPRCPNCLAVSNPIPLFAPVIRARLFLGIGNLLCLLFLTLPSVGIIFRYNRSHFLKSQCEVGEFLYAKGLGDAGDPLICILSQLLQEFPSFFRNANVLRSPVNCRLIGRQSLIHQRIS